jgi:hypothetical protein
MPSSTEPDAAGLDAMSGRGRGVAQDRPPKRRPAEGRSCATLRRKRNSAAGRGRHFAGRLDQRRALYQPPEILLVQMAPGDRLDGTLNLGEREFLRHQLERDRAVFELGAQGRRTARARGRASALAGVGVRMVQGRRIRLRCAVELIRPKPRPRTRPMRKLNSRPGSRRRSFTHRRLCLCPRRARSGLE